MGRPLPLQAAGSCRRDGEHGAVFIVPRRSYNGVMLRVILLVIGAIILVTLIMTVIGTIIGILIKLALVAAVVIAGCLALGFARRGRSGSASRRGR
jgi:hypothetical protein